jgi:calcineurin-like phosphoesterase family protein
MIDVGFLGDPHFGHEAIAKIRGFTDIDKYNQEVVYRINSVLHKKSLLYLMGDITMENSKWYHLLDEIKARIVVIGGNHDLKKDFPELMKHVEAVLGCLKYHGAIFTHIPIHTQEVNRFLFNAHAHTHEELIKRWIYEAGGYIAKEEIDSRYTCLSWDRLEGIPWSWEQILEDRKSKGFLNFKV